MKRILSCAAVAILLGGCANYSPSVPVGYTGPQATINDSFVGRAGHKIDFFYVSHVNGLEIENSRVKTLQMNLGNGMRMIPYALSHPIPARPTTLTIVGRTEYAAPILAFTGKVYEVKGTVEFMPEPDKTYFIRGNLGESHSAVWVEDDATKEVVGKKIEVNGSAALGFFEK
jgi:hypothetical protein